MKKLLFLGCVLLLTTSTSFGQQELDSTTDGELHLQIGAYYSTANTLGIEALIHQKKGVFGFGSSFSLEATPAIGADLTNNNYTYLWYDQILYEIGQEKTYSLYAIGGFHWDVFKVTGKLGWGGTRTIANFYDPDMIFGDYGYYYKEIDNGGKVLAGAAIDFRFAKNWYFGFGYDTYNKMTGGLTYEF